MNSKESWTGGTAEEYETQHFGFGAQRFKIAIRNMAEKKITDGVKNMESFIKKSLNLNDTDQSTLTHSCDKLVRLFCERAEPSLSVIDEEIERMLNIPPNVLLPGDECQLEQITDTEYEKLKEDVASLKKRVERGALMEALLNSEIEELSKVDSVCEAAKKDMEMFDLISKNCENNMETLKETVLACNTVNVKADKEEII